jgi:hypothetical protein
MKEILKVDNPNVYAAYVGAQILHPQLALTGELLPNGHESSLLCSSPPLQGLFLGLAPPILFHNPIIKWARDAGGPG